MPSRLLVLCGRPCAGKSTVAQQLQALFIAQGLTVELVDEQSLHLQRDAAYSDMGSEKNTRGLLRSALERQLASQPNGVTIMDSLNNIKVHVDTDTATCQSWNASRPEEERYSAAIFDDLASRFERPDAKNRWDSPLFTIKPAGDAEGVQQVIDAIVASMGDALGGQHDPKQVGCKDLKPSTTTSNILLQGTNVLHDLDAAVQSVIDSIADAQAAAAGGVAGLVRVPACQHTGPAGPGPPGGVQGEGLTLQLDQLVSLAELRRHKRAFMKLATKVTFSRLSDPTGAQRMFVDQLIEAQVLAAG